MAAFPARNFTAEVQTIKRRVFSSQYSAKDACILPVSALNAKHSIPSGTYIARAIQLVCLVTHFQLLQGGS